MEAPAVEAAPPTLTVFGEPAPELPLEALLFGSEPATDFPPQAGSKSMRQSDARIARPPIENLVGFIP